MKVDFLYDRKMYRLQAGACTFQPGNLTGWGSEGVNGASCPLAIVLLWQPGVSLHQPETKRPGQNNCRTTAVT